MTQDNAEPEVSPYEVSDRRATRSVRPPPPPPGAMAAQPVSATDDLSVEPEPLHETDFGHPPQRDRIVVLGRRQAGKTVFLAEVYKKLWKSVDGLTAKALGGEVHKQLMGICEQIRGGQWPSSTLGTSQIDLELEYHGRQRLLVALDFAGELFSKAFVDQQTDWPDVKELLNHIDHAAAVVLLVDPMVVSGKDQRAAMDDDFGLVQAVQRIRNWPDGDRVPIVMALTKCDQTQAVIDRFGGPLEFVRQHFRALLRMVKELPVIQISAVQTEIDATTKKRRPKRESTPINLDSPLRYALCAIEKFEVAQEQQASNQQRQAAMVEAAHQRELITRRAEFQGKILAATVSCIGAAAVFVILFFKL